MPRDTRHIGFDRTSCFETGMQSRCDRFQVSSCECHVGETDIVCKHKSRGAVWNANPSRDASKQHLPKYRCRSTRTNKAPTSKASKAAPRTCHGCTRRGIWRSRGIRTTVLRTPLPGKRVPHPRLSARRRSLSKLHWTGPHVLLPSNRRHDAPRAKFDREGTRMRIKMLENSLGLLRQRGLCQVCVRSDVRAVRCFAVKFTVSIQ